MNIRILEVKCNRCSQPIIEQIDEIDFRDPAVYALGDAELDAKTGIITLKYIVGERGRIPTCTCTIS